MCLVRNSFQRTWGVGMSDHACISGMFLVQAGATEGQLPEAEYLCVARPGLGPKVARRPAESETCAHRTQSLPFCNKDFEKDPRMVPPKRKGDLELRRKTIFSFFYFMKSDVGSLALLDSEERVFEMHLRLGPWMIYFLLFLGHLASGTYHLCLRISALTFGDVCWIPPFIFNNDTPLLLQNKIRLVSPLKEIGFFKN